MKKGAIGAASLILAVCVISAALATDGNLRVIQDDECMLLEGKDIFAYTSGELYTIWEAARKDPTFPEEASIGYSGDDEDDKKEGEQEATGFFFPFDGFEVMTVQPEADAQENGAEPTAPLVEQTKYPVKIVSIRDTRVSGPFGLEVGMTLATAQDLLPELSRNTQDVAVDKEYESYIMRYQDKSGHTYTLQVDCLLDMVVCCISNKE